MNHGKKLRRFRGSSGRKLALRRGLVTQLLHHESIVTTLAKAKGIVRSTDKMITLAKRNSNASRSLAQSFLYPAHFINPEALAKSLGAGIKGIRPLDYPIKRDKEHRLPRVSKLPKMSETMAEHSPLYRLPDPADKESFSPAGGNAEASSSTAAQQAPSDEGSGSLIPELEANDEDYAPPTSVLPKLFLTLNKRYADRPGGYTRLMRLGRRRHDNAPTAVICMVDGPRDFRFEMAARQAGLELAEHLGERIAQEPLHQGMAQHLSEHAQAEVDKVLDVRKADRVAVFWERAQAHADEFYIRPVLNYQRSLLAEDRSLNPRESRGLPYREELPKILRRAEIYGENTLSEAEKARLAEYRLPRESILALRPGLRPAIDPAFSVFDTMRKAFGKRWDHEKKEEVARMKEAEDATRPKVAIKRRYFEKQKAHRSLKERAREMFAEKLEKIEKETRESGAGFGTRGTTRAKDLVTGEWKGAYASRARIPSRVSAV